MRRIVLGTLLVALVATWVACKVGGMGVVAASPASPALKVAPEWGEPVRVGGPINTSAWEDSPGISADGNTLFFSRGRHDVGKRESVNVFVSRKVGRDWTMPTAADFNMQPYPTSAVKPKDAQMVYFASVRPGGHGQGDIYFASAQPGGRWSKGGNLGPPVNSKYNESEPCPTSDGSTLYFTSDRPGGMGGMDTWVSSKVDGKWGEPVNIGAPANSRHDDLQPFITADGKSLYFTRMNFALGGKVEGGYHAAILRCDRRPGGWSEPKVVVSDWVGEPSVTADGTTLYFVRVEFSRGKPVDADIWMTRRK